MLAPRLVQAKRRLSFVEYEVDNTLNCSKTFRQRAFWRNLIGNLRVASRYLMLGLPGNRG
jgi:hypothetical protein